MKKLFRARSVQDVKLADRSDSHSRKIYLQTITQPFQQLGSTWVPFGSRVELPPWIKEQVKEHCRRKRGQRLLFLDLQKEFLQKFRSEKEETQETRLDFWINPNSQSCVTRKVIENSHSEKVEQILLEINRLKDQSNLTLCRNQFGKLFYEPLEAAKFFQSETKRLQSSIKEAQEFLADNIKRNQVSIEEKRKNNINLIKTKNWRQNYLFNKRIIEDMYFANESLKVLLSQLNLARQQLFRYVLTVGYDTRLTGLVWVVQKLIQLEADPSPKDFPFFLDQKSVKYIIQVNLRNRQITSLKAQLQTVMHELRLLIRQSRKQASSTLGQVDIEKTRQQRITNQFNNPSLERVLKISLQNDRQTINQLFKRSTKTMKFNNIGLIYQQTQSALKSKEVRESQSHKNQEFIDKEKKLIRSVQSVEELIKIKEKQLSEMKQAQLKRVRSIKRFEQLVAVFGALFGSEFANRQLRNRKLQ